MQKPLLIDKSIQKLDILFRCSGMNIKNKIKTPIEVMKYRWLYAFNMFWVLRDCVPSTLIILKGIADGANFIELTCVAPCLIYGFLTISKAAFHLLHESEVQELIEVLKKIEVIENDKEVCIYKKNIIKDETGFLNKVLNILYVMNVLMVILFDMAPLVVIAVKYYRTNEFEMLLPFVDVFTFIPYKMSYWVLAYIHQVWSVCICLLFLGAGDYLLFTCCTYIRLQFRLLQYDIEKLIPYANIPNDLKDMVSQEDIGDEFAELVMRHQDLIKGSHILENIYSKSTLGNFLSSSIVICLTGFNVTFAEDLTVILRFVIFLFMGLLQVYFLCFFADMLMSAFFRAFFRYKLTLQSEAVSDGVYNSLWYLATPVVRKQLLIIQTRAQQPCKLTASGYTDVNLRAFMKVLSTAWSYFALLQTMYGE